MKTPKSGKRPTENARQTASKTVSGSRKEASAKASNTRQMAKRAHEAAASAQLEEKTCILPGSKPGYITICKIDRTGACTKDCIEVPDPGAQMLSFVMR